VASVVRALSAGKPLLWRVYPTQLYTKENDVHY